MNLNVAKMAIVMSGFFIIGNLPNAISFILSQLMDTTKPFYIIFVILSNAVLFLYHSLNLFIYIYYNKKFKECLSQLC